MQEPNEEMVRQWIETFHKYKDTLQPNLRSGKEILAYLKKAYPLTEIHDDEWNERIVESTSYYTNKADKKKLIINVYTINPINEGKKLYDIQDTVFKGIPITVGIECLTSYVYVEGSSYLYDELMAYRGLDKEELENYFLVAQYLACKEKFASI